MTSSSLTTDCVDFELDVLDAAKSSLRKALNSRISTVRCSFEGGMLVLSGQLPNWHQKQLAQEAVMCVAGVGRVSNEISVNGSAVSRQLCSA